MAGRLRRDQGIGAIAPPRLAIRPVLCECGRCRPAPGVVRGMEALADTIATDVAIVGAACRRGSCCRSCRRFRRGADRGGEPAGYHSTGRWRRSSSELRQCGIRALSRASWPLFREPDATLFPMPLTRSWDALRRLRGRSRSARQCWPRADLRELSLDSARWIPLLRRDGWRRGLWNTTHGTSTWRPCTKVG